jgi:CheY-like chemotaxis protein
METPPDHVLVVDDDPEIRQLLRAYLEKNGYRVTTAGDGTAMWQVLDRTRVDLVVLDITEGREAGPYDPSIDVLIGRLRQRPGRRCQRADADQNGTRARLLARGPGLSSRPRSAPAIRLLDAQEARAPAIAALPRASVLPARGCYRLGPFTACRRRVTAARANPTPR